MSHYYLADAILRKAGRRDMRFPAGYDLAADRNWLWLDRKPATRAVLWSRTPIVDPRLMLLAEDKHETASLTARRALEAVAKDREFLAGMSFADMVADLFMRPGEFRQGRSLVSDKRDQRFKLCLGPDLNFWSKFDPAKRSSTVSFSDDFSGNGSMDGRNFQPAGTPSWTRSDGTLWATSGGQSVLTNITAASYHRVYTSTDTDGADVFTQVDVATFAISGSSYLAYELLALTNASGTQSVGVSCDQQVGGSPFANRVLFEWDDPDFTSLDSDTSTDNTGTFRIEVSGTTVTAFRNGSQILTGGPIGLSTGAGNRRAAMTDRKSVV